MSFQALIDKTFSYETQSDRRLPTVVCLQTTEWLVKHMMYYGKQICGRKSLKWWWSMRFQCLRKEVIVHKYTLPVKISPYRFVLHSSKLILYFCSITNKVEFSEVEMLLYFIYEHKCIFICASCFHLTTVYFTCSVVFDLLHQTMTSGLLFYVPWMSRTLILSGGVISLLTYHTTPGTHFSKLSLRRYTDSHPPSFTRGS